MLGLGPLLEVAMSKKGTPLWREAHFQVKMHKHLSLGPLLEVEIFRQYGQMRSRAGQRQREEKD